MALILRNGGSQSPGRWLRDPRNNQALNELELFKDKWDSKYPKIYKSWNDNWATLSAYFKYPEAVRRLIYTTNAIEGFNRQLRKVTKSKTVFP